MSYLKPIALLPCIFLLSSLSCGNDAIIYNEIRETGAWSEEEKISFSDISQQENSEMILRVSYAEDYGFENLYLKASFYYHSQLQQTKIFSIQLMDINGMWLGRQSGKFRTVDHVLDHEIDENLKFTDLEIIQYSRESMLKGVKQIQLLVLRTPKK